jgi:hypothetical protein
MPVNALDQSKEQETAEDEGAPITKEREGHAGNRHKVKIHTNINKDMGTEDCGNADCKVSSKTINHAQRGAQDAPK